MLRKSTSSILIIWSIFFLIGASTACSFVIRENKKTYIVDRTGERWEVT